MPDIFDKYEANAEKTETNFFITLLHPLFPNSNIRIRNETIIMVNNAFGTRRSAVVLRQAPTRCNCQFVCFL